MLQKYATFVKVRVSCVNCRACI